METITGIGSALLDFTFEIDDALLRDLGLAKGTMQLIDGRASGELFEKMKGRPVQVTPGGSAANAMAGIANLGGASVFIGKVGNDENGKTYVRDTEREGVRALVSVHDSMTGHAITFITPDSERTFATHLGAALHLGPADIDESQVLRSGFLHLEGYILEGNMKAASARAMDIAKRGGVKISIDLADPAFVERNLAELQSVIGEYADIVFANEEEAFAFTGKRGNEALDVIAGMCGVAVVKLGPAGSLVGQGKTRIEIPPFPAKVVNTNGAGDMYAAGFLYALAAKLPVERAGRIGSYAASLVVASPGARFGGRIDISGI